MPYFIFGTTLSCLFGTTLSCLIWDHTKLPYLGQFWEEDGTNRMEYFDGEKAREHFLAGTVGPVLGNTLAEVNNGKIIHWVK